MINSISKIFIIAPLIILAPFAHGAGITMRNPPSECTAPANKCGCPEKKVSAKCIKVTVDLGETTPWTGSLECALKIFADNTSPSIFTAHSLYAVLGGYTFKRLGMLNLNDGITPAEVVLSHPNGEPVHFVFKEGESIARPDPGVHIKMDERLMMVDAQGWATTKEPVYYDLYVGDGSRRRFLATNMTGALGELVSITTPRGVTMTPADMGIDIVYDSNGVRQFLTPSRLANITHTDGWTGYDVTVYALRSTPQKDAQTGLYVLPTMQPIEVFSVRRENEERRAIVTVQKGGGDTLRYVFDYAMGDWSLTRPSGAQELRERYMADEYAARIVTSYVSSKGERLERTEYNYKWESWGFAVTNKVEGFGGVTDTTSWTYYTSGNGKGEVKTEKRQSGLLIEYAYDSADRLISEKRSGPDMMTEITTYAYAPVDPSDPALPVDTRPRTVVKTLNGIECERTYYVYASLTNIVERVGTQGAAYGGINVLRTVTTFYPIMGGPLSSAAADGRVASVRYEDGKLDLYDYALKDGIWTEIVTHLHEQSPAPVSGKTTRDITLTNSRGEVIETRTEAFIDNAWHTIARERFTYNVEGKRIKSENLAGQVTTTAWDCCHKISEVQPDGSTTMWDYDDEGRMIASSRLIPMDMTNVTWLTTCYEYDDLGRQRATWQTNRAAKVGLPATRTHYDALGRVVSRVDQLGNTTTMTRGPKGLAVVVQHPNMSTAVISNAVDGTAVSVTGTAGTPVFHTRGILPNGTLWSKTVQGETAESPRFTKRYENMLGQIVREERSGFRGAVLTAVSEYDSYGRLARLDADSEPTVEFEYDCFDTCVAVKHTAIAGRSQPGAPEWRRTEFNLSLAKLGSAVWFVQTNTVTCSDSAIAPFVTSTARKLTGLSSDVLAKSRFVDVRGNVSESSLSVSGTAVESVRSEPYAANKPCTVFRYGVPVKDVFISCATNTCAYDFLGRLVASTDGRGGTTRWEYGAFGLLSASIDALGSRTSYAYDRFGDMSAVTNAIGNAVFFERDLRGRVTLEYGDTYPISYTYDVFGNKTTMTTYRSELFGPDTGDVTTWLYDEASGAMTNKVYADGNCVEYDYTPDCMLARRVWARGVATEYSYDGWNNLAGEAYSDDTPTVSLFYDAIGRQTMVRDAAGETTFFYDSFGVLTNETVAGAFGTSALERYFDGFGRWSGYALDGMCQATVGYDLASGRVSTMRAGGDDAPFAWSYLPGSGLMASLSYPNGLVSSWQYDAENRLLQVRNAAGESAISQYDYTYDAIGRRTGIARHGSAMEASSVDAYGYNARNELVTAAKLGGPQSSATEYQYDYDNIGNRVSSFELGTNYSFSANNRNQYVMVGCVVPNAPQEDFEPQYDADGNQTLVKTATGIWHVQYNGENQPVNWTCGETNIVMSYDCMGRRVYCMEIVGTATNRTDAFSYNDYLLVARRRSLLNGASETDTFVWDPTEPVATRPLVLRGHGLQPRYYTHDGNKNVSELTSPEGTISAHYEYAPFGSVVASSCQEPGFCNGNPFRFSSEYADDALGLVYYNHRSYNPETGRWLSRDPFGDTADNNGYLMCRNYPVGMIDVLGLWWTLEHKKMTKEVLDEIRGGLPCLKDDLVYADVVRRIVAGNARMDTDDKYNQPNAEQLPLHFNSYLDGNQTVEDAKDKYRSGLKERRDNIETNALNSTEKCNDALEQMGQLTHMLQDYYGHGVGKDYKFVGTRRMAGVYGIPYIIPIYSAEIGRYYGTPDSPDDQQMKPSSYSEFYRYSDHGSLRDGEPAWRAPDKKERRTASKEVTAKELTGKLETWCEKCCRRRLDTMYNHVNITERVTVPYDSPYHKRLREYRDWQ